MAAEPNTTGVPDWAEGLHPDEAATIHDEHQAASVSVQMANLPDNEMPFPSTFLGGAPLEVREKIFRHMFEHNNNFRVDITIPHAKHGAPRLQFQRLYYQVPWFKEAFKTIMLVCKDLHDEVFEYLSRETVFFNRLSDSAKHLPTVFGSTCSMIRKLEIGMDFRTKIRHEEQFPMLLQMLTEHMANLTVFRLYSNYPTQNAPFPPHESGDPLGTARHSQELRAIMRFGAFATLRHTSLKVMVLPAASPSYDAQNDNTCCWIVLHPSHTDRKHAPYHNATTDTKHHDLILDSGLIRMLKWTELATLHPNNLALNFDIKIDEDVKAAEGFDLAEFIKHCVPLGPTDPSKFTSSESATEDVWNPYRIVDERGYSPIFMLKQKGFKINEKYNTVDKLIDDVRELEGEMLRVCCSDKKFRLPEIIHGEGKDVLRSLTADEEAHRVQAAVDVEERWNEKWARLNNKPGARGIRGSRGRGGAGRGGSFGGRWGDDQASQGSQHLAQGFCGGRGGRRGQRV